MQHCIQKPFLFILYSLIPYGLFSQGMYTVRHYTMEDGLAHNMTRDIIQDSRGYIWVGTWNGIDRFDGHVFRNFKSYPDDPVKLDNNRIENLTLNSADNLWAITHGQRLFLFDTATERFEDIFAGQQQPFIRSVDCLENGITWAIAGSGDLYRIDDRNYRSPEGVRFFGRAGHLNLGTTIHDIFADSSGDEWVLSDRGVLTVGRKEVDSNTPFHTIAEVGGTIFLATRDGYLATYGPEGRLVPFSLPVESDRINRLIKLDDEQLAVVTPYRIAIWHTGLKTCRQIAAPAGEEFIESSKILYDSRGNLWSFASGRKVICYDLRSDVRRELDYPDLSEMPETERRLSFFHEDEYGDIRVMLREGAFCIYNAAEEKLEITSGYNAGGDSHHSFNGRDYLVDTQRDLWISLRNGFYRLSFYPRSYERIGRSPGVEVRAILRDGQDRLWLGFKNGTIELYDRQNNYLGNLDRRGRIVADGQANFGSNIYCFFQDEQGDIWLGSRGEGLFVLTPQNERRFRVRQYRPEPNDPYSIGAPDIYSIIKDSQGRIWVGCYGGGLNLAEKGVDGTLRFIHAGNRLKNYPMEQCAYVRTIFESAGGTLLVGTNQGMVTFSNRFETPEEIAFFYNYCSSDRSDCLSNSDVRQFFQTRSGDIHVSTFSGGIDVTADSPELLSGGIRFRNLNKTNGLASDLSLTVVEDPLGFVWIVSVGALSRLDPESGAIDHFDRNYFNTPIQLGEAMPAIDPDGNLVFGTTDGALRLLTDRVRPGAFVPPVVFTAVDIQGEHPQRLAIKRDAHMLTLARDQRNISISFAALDYANPKTIRYAYRLGGEEGEWIHTGENRSASFINLPAGEHLFEVRSTNSDGVWVENTASLPIRVMPGFWETGWAWSVYIAGFLSLVLLGVLIPVYILKLRRKVDFEQELTQMKLKYFTDISHELRTPLTLISGPIDDVLSREPLTDAGRASMLTARQNTDRMLRLINQILDFRKIQDRKMKVRLEQTDIVLLLRKVFSSFAALAERRQIRYSLETNEESFDMATDPDKVEKIVFNLLSNAFKYTPVGQRISLTARVGTEGVTICVQDDGSGFDMRKAERLFQRFETDDNADPGISSGIGLSLVKELVNLLHGEVEVESGKDSGTRFSVWLPTNDEVFANDPDMEWIGSDHPETEWQPEDERTGYEERQTCVLVIEDNEELRHFIRNVLSRDYRVLEAADGRQGLEITLHEAPDVVISDIMMPEMDGVQYLKAVKANRDVSHIPVVLLTAKSSIDDQIAGMECGADDYIAKPFNFAYLKSRIAALLKRRELLRRYYLSGRGEGVRPLSHPAGQGGQATPAPLTGYDDEFILRVIRSIEENIDNPRFKIETIAGSLNLSRPVFYRKIKAIIGLSPIEFVKKIRIEHAVKLLETRKFTVAEVAYRSGFSSPQYLSRIFREAMGCSPSDYLHNKLKGES